MGRIAKLMALPMARRWLLVKAAGLLALVRLALRIFPFPVVRPVLMRAGRQYNRLSANRAPPLDIAWAVSAVSQCIPGGGHCLSQALTLQTFLTRRGYPSAVCFGVQKAAGTDLRAHAWVEYEGRVLIGDGQLDRFARLSAP
jgi:hypothetical protein